MYLSNNELIIALSLLFILSYLFNFISAKIRIPSVLLLLGTGMILKAMAAKFGITFVFPQSSLELIGTFGLILIVLEASLDLHLTKDEMPTVRSAFASGVIIFLISTLAIALILKFWLGTSLKQAVINGIPLAVISSAIAIPSVATMNKQVKSFIIYESTFSDIIGIMIFNYAIQENILNYKTIGALGLSFISILIISFLASGLLIFLMSKIRHQKKFFLIIVILLLIYAIGKEAHLPSLLMVLVFGLMTGNFKYLVKGKFAKHFNSEHLSLQLTPFKAFTEETAFLIRTFFFVLFGYSVNLQELLEMKILLPGLAITASLLLIRYIYIRFTVKEGYRVAKLFLAPRGLITVILFYSIPAQYILPDFTIGVVFIVIILTGLMMTLSLILGEKGINLNTLTPPTEEKRI
ncbi:MAG: cation:proton antiporter [Sporocytophaga sp.]|nr:cation:proton antiporter [Sporocytophaga sp.]